MREGKVGEYMGDKADIVPHVALLFRSEVVLTFVCIHGEVRSVNLLQSEPSTLLQANLLLQAIHCVPEGQWGAVVLPLLAEELAEAFQVGRIVEYLLEGPEGGEGKSMQGMSTCNICMCVCVCVCVCVRVYSLLTLAWVGSLPCL